MTIFSAEQIFSDQQAITATAVSTNILDLGATGTPHKGKTALVRDIGKGTPVPILIQVTVAFNTLTSLLIEIEMATDAAFTTPIVRYSELVLLADLVAGKQIFANVMPKGVDLRFVRCNYTVAGTDPTVGKITAGITMGNQTNP